MANSVVKVTDIRDDELDNVNNSLLLLVGEDGTVTPDQETVETFLKHRSGPTNIQVMKFLKTDKQGIDITVDNLTYVPDVANEEVVGDESADMDEVARNLYNFRLDHDYTPFTSPDSQSLSQEEDELAKTLSMLDGPEEIIIPPEPITLSPLIGAKVPPRIKLIQSITLTPPNRNSKGGIGTVSANAQESSKNLIEDELKSEQDQSINDDIETASLRNESTPATSETIPTELSSKSIETIPDETKLVLTKSKAKIIRTAPKSKSQKERAKIKTKPKVKGIVGEESDEEDYSDGDDLDFELEDDENDLDFSLEEELKGKQHLKRQRLKSESRPPFRGSIKRNKSKEKKGENKEEPKKEDSVKVEAKQEPTEVDLKEDKVVEKTDEKQERQPETLEAKQQEKKPLPKKDKKVPKPIPDDFLLFSTPDIIRRVGGKEQSTPESVTPTKPAKILSQGSSQRKSLDQSPTKSHGKTDKERFIEEKMDSKSRRSSLGEDTKSKERRASMTNESKLKRTSVDERTAKSRETKAERRSSDAKKVEKTPRKSSAEVGENLDMPSAEYIRSIIMNEDTKTYSMDTNMEQPSNLENLDATGLDLDPTLLDNLNNDEISEDILYQVAKSLVSNPELQNAIDKGINDGVLDPTVAAPHNALPNQSVSGNPPQEKLVQGGTQIVRPDGRIVVIPPIERPTTRSRNKRKEETKPTIIAVHKPLDEEHVSGNELDSSADEGAAEEEEEESEDDPNKLWCICNQPHNNRFMICCDTCEEWYHGKCVNITKSMGQQMEAEGKEWICLFCKDPLLERPQAAARRIRKASRNSRASSDSAGSNSKRAESTTTSVPCVVCQKLSRKNSIYCSESCILAHAQGIERVIVFERSTGKMLTGNKAPSAANLDQWLKEHPGYEVVRSGGKIVTAKAGNLTQSKLKLVKNVHDEGVSLAVHKKGGVNVGVLKHAPLKHAPKSGGGAEATPPKQQGTPLKQHATPLKGVVTAIRKAGQQQQPDTAKMKVIPPEPMKLLATPPTPKQPKLLQTTLTKTPPVSAEKKKTPKKREEQAKKKEEQAKKKEEPPSPKPQENIRENVKKTVFEQLTNRLKGCADLKLTEEEVKVISGEIESQLHKCFGDTGQKYRNKYRSLIFNIKDSKNQTLWRRICEKSVNPYELVRLSPDDLASQELASWREKEAKHTLDMIKKSELELLNCNRQYVLKTHKGEQVVEDDRVDKIDNAEMIKSLTEGSALDSGESKSDGTKDKKGSSKHGGHKDRDKKNKDKEHRSHRSSSKDKERDRERSRKRSKSRDRKHGGEHKKHSRSKDRSRDRQHRKSSHKASKHKKDLISSTDKLDKKAKEILEQLVDNKIVLPLAPLDDRLWKHVPQEDILPAIESDSDHEPSSTVTIPTPPRVPDSSDEFAGGGRTPEIDIEKNLPTTSAEKENVREVKEAIVRSTSPPPRKKPPAEIWRGAVNMIDVAQISITAHEVSGDCSGLGRELSPNLDIVGRISPDTVWDYISKMKCSNSKGISLIRLNATNVEEKMPYLALYSYLSSRDRLGVVKSLNKAVKDFYIYPLAPQKPIPQVLLPISGPGFEESRPALLLGIIVRDKRKRPFFAPPDMPVLAAKKSKTETVAFKAASPAPATPAAPVAPPRSYTPPPVKDPRLKQPPKPEPEPSPPDEGDEPYSPEDSDLEAPTIPVSKLQTVLPVQESSVVEVPVVPPFPIPGISSGLPSSTLEIQRQMEELNKKIEMQKSEITSMTQNMASAASTSKDIGSTSLANIALPSNLQQILDSIKTIGDGTDHPPPTAASAQLPPPASGDLTIPLIIPKSFTRPLNMSVPPPPLGVVLPELACPVDTIPLNLPKGRQPPPPPAMGGPEERAGVLSSLSEEQLIQKANEMLQDQEGKSKKRPSIEVQASVKRSRNEVNLPPVPGLEDDAII
ncbi:unnamed protein product [Phaedon cochleariae]|uniref:Death-inducer obliterator 1 n=1 Tax=Phaedon cochleariae TaxID=80249 RepID=A0A9N9X5H0_PHACE|nr:unnamed protein product [Phaedon cochleariae]